MAETDLDIVIRSLGKQQQRALMSEARKRQARLMGLAATAKSKESRARYRQAARDMMPLARAAARRLLITAENTADSYKRAMNKAMDESKATEAASSAKRLAKSKT